MARTDESRRGRRVRVEIPVLLVCGNEQFSTHTENASLLGTYISVGKQLPIGAEVRLTLDLSQTSYGGQVQCQGVLVRCEALPSGLFGLGVFFNQFQGDGEARLDAMIEDLLIKQNEEAQRYFEERERLRKERMKKKLAERRRKRRKRGRPPKKRRAKPAPKTE
ncbi:MAG: PilZ domain-containing protein [Candidatus Omnitrophota bacterium]